VRYHIVAGSQFSGSLDMQEKKTWPHKNSTGKKEKKSAGHVFNQRSSWRR